MSVENDGVSTETVETPESMDFASIFEREMQAAEAADENPAPQADGEVDPTEGGEVEDPEVATESGTTETEDEIWNWQEYASKPMKIKVAGQEVVKTLQEIAEDGMRQADYTRKTQELAEKVRLAEWAENFQRQLRDDPATVLRTLQAAFQQEMQPEIDPYEQQIAKLVEQDPDLAPMAQMVLEERRARAALEAQLAQQQRQVQESEAARQQREVIAMVQAEIAEVKVKHPDMDEDIALQIAASKPGLTLEEAWILHKATQPVSTETAPAPKKEAPAPKTEAKQALAATQTNSRLQGTPDVSPEDYTDFSELFEIMARTAQR